MVIQADKGNCTVVLDKQENIEKAQEMLADTNTYRKLNKSPTKKIRSKQAENRRKNNTERFRVFRTIHHSSHAKILLHPKNPQTRRTPETHNGLL